MLAILQKYKLICRNTAVGLAAIFTNDDDSDGDDDDDDDDINES
ncbi:MAG: hypothetical protein N0E59_01465 [Candidatus Thiodiazotropha taylori]|nr:hypothetical protein [Candidatus Thiodiazotropha endolucinida]MCW4281749.1 hypothetical protein [Candidatus Thiodiazotropha taylori]